MSSKRSNDQIVKSMLLLKDCTNVLKTFIKALARFPQRRSHGFRIKTRFGMSFDIKSVSQSPLIFILYRFVLLGIILSNTRGCVCVKIVHWLGMHSHVVQTDGALSRTPNWNWRFIQSCKQNLCVKYQSFLIKRTIKNSFEWYTLNIYWRNSLQLVLCKIITQGRYQSQKWRNVNRCFRKKKCFDTHF